MPHLIWTAPMCYFSQRDEEAFFVWLQSIPGVVDVHGEGKQLIIQLKSKRLSAASLREFVALYRRYGGNMAELVQFSTPSNASWFNSEAPAYREVFKKNTRA